MNLVKGFHRSFFIADLYRRACSSSRPCNNQIFTSLHRACSSMRSIIDIPPSLVNTKPGKMSAYSPKIQKINKAMKAYLERAMLHEDFIHEKNVEFEIGKRHLANMMGMDPETLTQENIDMAIAYLMPSGLYEKRARPMMKPPVLLYPKEKAAQFDETGRPFSCFFYTGKSNLCEANYQIVEKFIELDAFEDKMLRRGIDGPPEESAMYIGGSRWMNIDEIRNMLLENISETEYKVLIQTLERLSAHPYAFRCKDFIFKFRNILAEVTQLETIPDLIQDESGRLYITAESKRNTVTAKVTVWGNGEGKVKINNVDIGFFQSIADREQIMYPLLFTGLLGHVDLEATVTGEGHSAHAGAIRHALSLCLRSFITREEVERMRLAGLLTRDPRRRERKKPGQKGARAKYTWKKR